MSTTTVENALSTLSKSNAVNCDYAYDANSLMKSNSKTHEVPVVEDAPAVGSPIQNSPSSTQKRKLFTTLSSSDHLHHLLEKFAQFARENPELSPAAVRVGQEVLRFIAKPDRQHECEEFLGVWREEFDTIVHFIDDNHNFGLKPRLTYIDSDSTLIVKMPSAVHEAPLTALHSAFTCFFENLPFDSVSINANVLTNVGASNALIPDLRVSLQNMRNSAAEVIVPVIGETAFSQHPDVLMDKLQTTLDANPSIMMLILAVVTEHKRYSSPVKDSPSRMAFMRDGSIRSAVDFIAASDVLPTLDAPVIVEGHTWCSVESVMFKVWVRGNGVIDLETHNPAFVAEGTLYPVDNMDPVLNMIQKGVRMMRGQLISMALAIDPDVDVDALQDPAIKFSIKKGSIATKIVGAMRETAYSRYSAWYDQASKTFKRKATFEQLPPTVGPPASNTRAKAKAKRRMVVSRGCVRTPRRKGT